MTLILPSVHWLGFTTLTISKSMKDEIIFISLYSTHSRYTLKTVILMNLANTSSLYVEMLTSPVVP